MTHSLIQPSFSPIYLSLSLLPCNVSLPISLLILSCALLWPTYLPSPWFYFHLHFEQSSFICFQTTQLCGFLNSLAVYIFVLTLVSFHVSHSWASQLHFLKDFCSITWTKFFWCAKACLWYWFETDSTLISSRLDFQSCGKKWSQSNLQYYPALPCGTGVMDEIQIRQLKN